MIFTVSGDTTCNIASTNVINVTATGGVITIGTQNVIIYCLCARNGVTRSGGSGIRWYLNGTQITLTSADGTGNPYSRNVVPNQLIIPSFVYPYNGMYSCGFHTNEFAKISSHINLTLAGI